MTKLQLKLNKKSALVWAAILGLFIVLFMAVFPSMANESMQKLVDAKLEGLPPALLSLVGFDTIPDFTDITVFYAYIMQYMNIALVIYALSLGLSSFLQEETDKTIEFLFAQPISRKELILNKFMANAITTFLVVSVIVLGSILSFYLFKPEDILLMSLIEESIFVFVSYYVLAFIFLILGSGLSLLLKPGTKVSGVSMGLVFSTYFIGVMAMMSELLAPLKSISILHALFPSEVYSNKVNGNSVMAWGILALIVFVFGLLRFMKRDIEV